MLVAACSKRPAGTCLPKWPGVQEYRARGAPLCRAAMQVLQLHLCVQTVHAWPNERWAPDSPTEILLSQLLAPAQPSTTRGSCQGSSPGSCSHVQPRHHSFSPPLQNGPCPSAPAPAHAFCESRWNFLHGELRVTGPQGQLGTAGLQHVSVAYTEIRQVWKARANVWPKVIANVGPDRSENVQNIIRFFRLIADHVAVKSSSPRLHRWLWPYL